LVYGIPAVVEEKSGDVPKVATLVKKNIERGKNYDTQITELPGNFEQLFK
jgi:hypothetical protein